MVDVGWKPETRREALARGTLTLSPEALRLLKARRLPKGDALEAARVAGILAAKRSSDLIPLCHPLPLENVEVRILPGRRAVTVEALAKATARTGVEMEALTAVCVACLTLYDMTKSLDRGMRITNLCLLEKSGGRSGTWKRSKP